ncbi:hypothetical protein FB45DRAFT_76216 [Roridomyces roridus]|uniref:Uncharacterized protein n=1 Tax=Roridomyces roridus TaxID=1738132 RepID=A0AAD7BNN1_9AGAR|nr:hypothetical protein FB45DRAFT_76216 [Roridomyces roridus]
MVAERILVNLLMLHCMPARNSGGVSGEVSLIIANERMNFSRAPCRRRVLQIQIRLQPPAANLHFISRTKRENVPTQLHTRVSGRLLSISGYVLRLAVIPRVAAAPDRKGEVTAEEDWLQP